MFNLEQYNNLIKRLVDIGLKPTTDWNEKLDANSLLLRHDIDFSIEYAYQLARAENKLKICSTFFFMITSNLYNLLSEHNQKLVNEIADMGHKISIHYDPTAHEGLEEFAYEKNIFEKIFKVKVDIVSIHRPGSFLDNNNILISGISQTYQDIYYKKMKYISDSAGRNIFPPISEYLEGPRDLGLHLLIHPIWWIGTGNNPKEKLNDWSNKKFNFISSEIRKNTKKIYED